MRRCKSTLDIFFGVEQRMTKEDMGEPFNREPKQSWRFAAGAARITDENASSEGRKHTSVGLLVAVDSNLGVVIGKVEGSVASIASNEGRIAQAWVNVRGGTRVFSVYFWHSEGWKSRNEVLMEAVVKQVMTTKHPWLIASDANMCLDDLKKRLWFQSRHMFIEASQPADPNVQMSS